MEPPAGSALPGPLEAGAVLGGRYEVECALGRGAMGAVYKVVDRDTRDEVAVKHLLDPSQQERFEIESRLLASLHHPRIVRVLDHFSDGDLGHFLVMELVRGPDLAQVLEDLGDPGLPLPSVLLYAEQVAEALDYVHKQRIVHRDVKPQNLILGEQGVVLVDFGVARQVDDWKAGTAGVGTPRMMAPEVFAGDKVSNRSDVYSLAATVWTLLAGEPPSYSRRTSLVERCGVPQYVEDALLHALEFMPEHRTPSAEAFARDLKRSIDVDRGSSLGISVPAGRPSSLMEGIVRTAAGVFDAAAASIALVDPGSGDLVYQAAWGAGASEILGVRLKPGQGIAGSALVSGESIGVADCRSDPRFAAAVASSTGYVPVTLMALPLCGDDGTVGVLTLVDRRDGKPYGADDLARGELFAELATLALDFGPDVFSATRMPGPAHR